MPFMMPISARIDTSKRTRHRGRGSGPRAARKTLVSLRKGFRRESGPNMGLGPASGGGGMVATPADPSTGTTPPGAGQATVLASGEFRSLEPGTSGRAVVLELADGSRVLRFEALDTSNGPDLHVYLSEVAAGDDARGHGEGFVDLGKLKGNKGNQNYAIPTEVDLARYRSAVIWCKRFAVGFGVAPLDRSV